MLEYPTYEELKKRVMALERANAESRRAEAKLREIEDDYHALVDNLSAGVYRNTGGPQGRFIWANPAIARMFGYDSVEAFMEVAVSDLYVDPGERQRFVDEVKKSGVVKEWELRLKRRDGTPFWASCTATVKRDERGEIQWMDGIIYDISERKEAEKALRRTNEVLNNILTASPVGIGLLDRGVIRWANGEMVRMFGFDDRNDYVGKSIRVVYPSDEEYDRVFTLIKSRFKSGEPPEVEAFYRRKDGSTFVGHFKMSCPDPEEPSKRAIFAINDISWRAQAEAEKLEKEKVQAVLETAGAVCHEMNQPIQRPTSLSETLLMYLGETTKPTAIRSSASWTSPDAWGPSPKSSCTSPSTRPRTMSRESASSTWTSPPTEPGTGAPLLVTCSEGDSRSMHSMPRSPCSG